MMKIRVNKLRLVSKIDEYGLFVVAIFFSFGFSLYSSNWIYKSPVFDKLGFAFTLVLLPLFVVGVQVILKSKSSENTEAENDLKIFNFFYNFFFNFFHFTITIRTAKPNEPKIVTISKPGIRSISRPWKGKVISSK